MDDSANPGDPQSFKQFDERLDRLEQALVDIRLHFADRVVERLLERLPKPEPTPASPTSEEFARDVADRLSERIPSAEAAPPEDVAKDVVERLLEQVPSLKEPAEPPPPPPLPLSPPGTAWFLFEVGRELRLMVRMFFDRRYRFKWTSILLLLVLVPLILLSHWWSPLSWVLGVISPTLERLVDKLVDLVLAFILYKAIGREVRRYDAFLRR